MTEKATLPSSASQCQFCASELGSRRSQPTLNQTGELKAHFWLTRRWVSSAKKICGVLFGGEVAVAHAPVADGLGYAGDEVADTLFALGGADLAVKVFAGDDVGGGDGPVGGDFYGLLLEDEAAFEVLDDGVTKLPGELVEGVDAGLGEVTREVQAGGGAGVTGGSGGGGGLLGCGVDKVGHGGSTSRRKNRSASG